MSDEYVASLAAQGMETEWPPIVGDIGAPGKPCESCKRDLLLEAFSPDKRFTDGYDDICLECKAKLRAERRRKNREANPEQERERLNSRAAYMRKYRRDNKERINKQRREATRLAGEAESTRLDRAEAEMVEEELAARADQSFIENL